MKATTLKIENPLLDELYSIKPKTQSLSNFVRGILDAVVRRNKMIQAGESYADFLQKNSTEAVWLDEWESADLAAPVNAVTKKR